MFSLPGRQRLFPLPPPPFCFTAVAISSSTARARPTHSPLKFRLLSTLASLQQFLKMVDIEMSGTIEAAEPQAQQPGPQQAQSPPQKPDQAQTKNPNPTATPATAHITRKLPRKNPDRQHPPPPLSPNAKP